MSNPDIKHGTPQMLNIETAPKYCSSSSYHWALVGSAIGALLGKASCPLILLLRALSSLAPSANLEINSDFFSLGTNLCFCILLSSSRFNCDSISASRNSSAEHTEFVVDGE